MNKNTLTLIFIGLALYFLSAGISYFIFGQVLGKGPLASNVPLPSVNQNGEVKFDQSLPKTQECPLNGVKYSTQQEKWWSTHGPLAVMIENHEEARPQSGLSHADVVYEAVAEGGITRFMAVFYCQDGGQVGPVRSARTYFIDFASEYGNFPLYAHVGGANAAGPADALGQLDTYGWTNNNDLNQFSIGFPTFWRDYDRLSHTVATEHTMYSSTVKLWDYAAKNRKLTNVDGDGKAWDTNFVPYKFQDDPSASQLGSSQTIDLQFWNNSAYYVNWKYDPKTNTYLRFNGGVAHLDKDTGKQIAVKDIIVLLMREQNANDGYENNVHLLYADKGTGKALVFMNGKQINATWSKSSRTARTIIKDSSGKELTFDRGLMWFEVMANDSTINVK